MAGIELSTQYAVYLSLSSRVAWEPPGGEQDLGEGHSTLPFPLRRVSIAALSSWSRARQG
jgi:hypothetical protein